MTIFFSLTATTLQHNILTAVVGPRVKGKKSYCLTAEPTLSMYVTKLIIVKRKEAGVMQFSRNRCPS